ncbi:MAG: sulfatase [Thermoanaerobaculia bacterium]|nr:sulfatase [Thermoanaerobaculia bacterium]
MPPKLGPPNLDPPNIIVVSLDTVRSDFISERGSKNRLSNLDALTEESLVFANAFSPIPFTLAAHMSMFTGLSPWVHRVDSKNSVLSPGVVPLAQRLQSRGYRTLGLVSNIWMEGDFGFERGFDHYERLPVDLTYAARVNRRLFQLLDDQPSADGPTFLFLHYIDAHSDYSKDGRNLLPYYAASAYLEPMGLTPLDGSFCDGQGRCATDFLTGANRDHRQLPPDLLAGLRGTYDAGIRSLDNDLGTLFDGLKARNLWAGSWILVTSDHGEEFQEHGRLVHSQPFVELLSIPLIVKPPEGSEVRLTTDAPVTLEDITPSILDLVGAETIEGIKGISGRSFVKSDARSARSFVVGRDKHIQTRYSIRNLDYAAVFDLKSGVGQLFDRRKDPGELEDIQAREPEVFRELVTQLRSYLAREKAEGRELQALDRGSVLGAEEQEQLRAIGYLN